MFKLARPVPIEEIVPPTATPHTESLQTDFASRPTISRLRPSNFSQLRKAVVRAASQSSGTSALQLCVSQSLSRLHSFCFRPPSWNVKHLWAPQVPAPQAVKFRGELPTQLQINL